MENVIIIVLIVILAFLALLIIPRWRLQRATRQVIRILRQHNAIDVKNAKTIDELGLRPRGRLEGLLRTRDYKPYALDALWKAEIVKITEDGRVYLSEDRLLASGLGKDKSYPGQFVG